MAGLMSRLKVTDLSFCETEFDASERVKGGMLSVDYFASYSSFGADFPSPAAKSNFQLVEQSLAKDGYQTSYYYDNSTGGFALVATKGNGSAKASSKVTKSYFYNGQYVSSIASAAI